jgi:hypothetical protein
MLAAVVIAPPAGATPVSSNDFPFEGIDFTVEVVAPPDIIAATGSPGLLNDDPLGLIPQRPLVQRYSLDRDRFEVWLCGGTGYTMNQATYSTVGSPEGQFIIDSVTRGGYASPGLVCAGDPECSWIGSTFPDNGRFAVIGAGSLRDFPMAATHELGHTLHWPHSTPVRPNTTIPST